MCVQISSSLFGLDALAGLDTIFNPMDVVQSIGLLQLTVPDLNVLQPGSSVYHTNFQSVIFASGLSEVFNGVTVKSNFTLFAYVQEKKMFRFFQSTATTASYCHALSFLTESIVLCVVATLVIVLIGTLGTFVLSKSLYAENKVFCPNPFRYL